MPFVFFVVKLGVRSRRRTTAGRSVAGLMLMLVGRHGAGSEYEQQDGKQISDHVLFRGQRPKNID